MEEQILVWIEIAGNCSWKMARFDATVSRRRKEEEEEEGKSCFAARIVVSGNFFARPATNGAYVTLEELARERSLPLDSPSQCTVPGKIYGNELAISTRVNVALNRVYEFILLARDPRSKILLLHPRSFLRIRNYSSFLDFTVVDGNQSCISLNRMIQQRLMEV